MTFTEYLGLLFKSATGWLGWSPADALASPMPMIEAAMEGRIEMLKAVFGGGSGKGGKGHSPAKQSQEEQAAIMRAFLIRQKVSNGT